MPIFEFKCNQCDNSFETLVLGGDTPECPSCKSNNLEKLMSACGFVSKSSGYDPGGRASAPAASSSCGSCSSTSCSTCGHG